MGGLETGPRFSFETGHCNLKKSALLQMSNLSFCPVYSTLQGGNCFLVSVKAELVSEGICQKKRMILQKMISFLTLILMYLTTF